MKKLVKKLPFLLLVLLQSSFLVAILFEKFDILPILAFIIAIFILIVIAYTKVPAQENKHLKEDFLAVAFVVLGAAITFSLHNSTDIGPVIAAGTVGTVASFVPLLHKKSKLLTEIPAATYCGAFVGMSSQQVAGNMLFILFASFVAGLLLVFSKNIFHGFGGKLGTIAFGGVAVTYLLIFLLN